MQRQPLPPYLAGQITDAILVVSIEVAEQLGYRSGQADGVAIPTEEDIVLALRQPVRAALILARLADLLGVEPPPEVRRACYDTWDITWNTHPPNEQDG